MFKSVFPADSEVMFERAMKLYEEGAFAAAFKSMRRAGEAGFTPAFLNLGVMYCDGRPGVRRDRSKALHWFKRALATPLKSQKAMAMLNIALLYRDEYRNARMAKFWLRHAIFHGEISAYLELAKLLEPTSHAQRIRSYLAQVSGSHASQTCQADMEEAQYLLSHLRTQSQHEQ